MNYNFYFRSHSHANTLSYYSTLVKLASCKRHFNVNQHLEAKLAHVMNTNIVPIIILGVSKVFWWPHNHLMHWSHMITSIIKYMSNIPCDKEKVNEMKLHMLMLMNEWMMLVLMKCKSQMQCLTLGCYRPILPSFLRHYSSPKRCNMLHFCEGWLLPVELESESIMSGADDKRS